MSKQKGRDQRHSDDQWESVPDGVRDANPNRRAVVSVSMAREDFERVSEYARKHGMKTSEFLRQAALDRIGYQRAELVSVRVSGSIFGHYPRQTEIGAASTVRLNQSEVAVSH